MWNTTPKRIPSRLHFCIYNLFIMYIWGITKKYHTLSWWENFMGGHITFGPITIFGANAMNWTVQAKTPIGYLCFTLPVIARYRYDRNGKKWWQWYAYLSPNGTPWACTWYIGSNTEEKIRARIRRYNFGHGFDTAKYRDELYAINHKFCCLKICEYDIDTFGLKESEQ